MNFKKYLFLLFIIFGILTFSENVLAFRFVVYSDSQGVHNGTFNQPVLGFINSKIVSLNPLPAFVCFMGDAVDRPIDDSGHHNLPDWHTFMINTLHGIPFYLVPGNHDLSENSGVLPTLTLQDAFRSEFSDNTKNNGPTGLNGLFIGLNFFVEYGEGDSKSLFIFLDSYTVDTKTNPPNTINYFADYNKAQDTIVPWYQNLLATTTAKHIFVFSHMPFFSVSGITALQYGSITSNQINGIGSREIFYGSNNVDIFFSGHNHLYSRWTLFPSNFIKAPQIITGRCGAPPEDEGDEVVPLDKTNIHLIYNYTIVDVDGKNVKLQAFGIIDNGGGNFSQVPIDKAVFRK